MFEISLVSIILILKGILQCVWKNIFLGSNPKVSNSVDLQWEVKICVLNKFLSEADASDFDLTLLQFMKSLGKYQKPLLSLVIKVIHRKLLNIFFLPFYFFISLLFFTIIFFFSFPSLPPFLLLNPHRTFSYWACRYR